MVKDKFKVESESSNKNLTQKKFFVPHQNVQFGRCKMAMGIQYSIQCESCHQRND